MSSLQHLDEILASIREEITYFVATGVINIESGLLVASNTADPNFDAATISACYAEVCKSTDNALEILGLGPHTAEDILITLKSAFFIVRMLGRDHYVGLVFGKQGTLGMARAVLKKHDPALVKILSEMS